MMEDFDEYKELIRNQIQIKKQENDDQLSNEDIKNEMWEYLEKTKTPVEDRIQNLLHIIEILEEEMKYEWE